GGRCSKRARSRGVARENGLRAGRPRRERRRSGLAPCGRNQGSVAAEGTTSAASQLRPSSSYGPLFRLRVYETDPWDKPPTVDRQERLALNESLFRETNERLAATSAEWGFVTGVLDLLCECADVDCTERIDVGPREYE